MADREKDQETRAQMPHQINREKAPAQEPAKGAESLNDLLHPKNSGISRAQIEQKESAEADRLLSDMRQKRDRNREQKRGYDRGEY